MTDLNQSATPSGGDRPAPRADVLAYGPDSIEALVEQAKGVVMFRRRLTADEAGQLLSDWSRDRGVSTPTLASALVHDLSGGGGRTAADGSRRDLLRWLESHLRR